MGRPNIVNQISAAGAVTRYAVLPTGAGSDGTFTGVALANGFLYANTYFNCCGGGAFRIAAVSPSLAPAAVPTLSEWAMILFGTLLAGGAALYIQRRRQTV